MYALRRVVSAAAAAAAAAAEAAAAEAAAAEAAAAAAFVVSTIFDYSSIVTNLQINLFMIISFIPTHAHLLYTLKFTKSH